MPFRDPEDFRTHPPQTEDSAERGLVKTDPKSPDPETYRDLGQTQHPEDGSDIADEGRGHRG